MNTPWTSCIYFRNTSWFGIWKPIILTTALKELKGKNIISGNSLLKFNTQFLANEEYGNSYSDEDLQKSYSEHDTQW